jgi:hypothetical protein
MSPLGLLSRHLPDAQGALQQSLILQGDNLQVNKRVIGKQDRSVICQKSVTPFTQLNEHSLGTTKEDIAKCFSSGCDDYLAKLIDHDKLYAILDKYLSIDSKHESGVWNS